MLLRLMLLVVLCAGALRFALVLVPVLCVLCFVFCARAGGGGGGGSSGGARLKMVPRRVAL